MFPPGTFMQKAQIHAQECYDAFLQNRVFGAAKTARISCDPQQGTETKKNRLLFSNLLRLDTLTHRGNAGDKNRTIPYWPDGP